MNLKTMMSVVMVSAAGLAQGAEGDWPSTPALTPIRHAHGHVVMKKVIPEKSTDGTYNFGNEVVCDKTFEISVYDMRGAEGFSFTPDIVRCDSTVDGKKVDLVFQASIQIEHGEFMEGEGMRDSKQLTSFFSVNFTSIDSPGQVQPVIPSYFSTYDLGLKNFLTSLAPIVVDCVPGKTACNVMPESFLAKLSVED